MNDSLTTLAGLLARAKSGDREAVGELLEAHRPLLRFLALRYLDGPLGGRLDASDLVQQTCLSVFRRIEQFDGNQPAEFVAWLKRIHERNLQNAIRDHLLVQKRAAGREVSIADGKYIERTETPHQSSPSQRLMQGEQAVRLAAALQSLPEDQREAVRLRYLEGRPVAEIAERLKRSVVATAGLLKRGLVKLRAELSDESRGGGL
jgi:RNA polymerase sigma-70 factor, ECF subfamily